MAEPLRITNPATGDLIWSGEPGDAAAEAVKSALLLDEVSRRENITASDAEVANRKGSTLRKSAGLSGRIMLI